MWVLLFYYVNMSDKIITKQQEEMISFSMGVGLYFQVGADAQR